MRLTLDEMTQELAVDGIDSRATECGEVLARYVHLPAGVDFTPLFQGLPGDLCQCPHWGYVIKGRITTTDARGARETVNTNDLFYWPPGHNVQVEDDAEIVMFSPEREHVHVIDHMIEKVKG